MRRLFLLPFASSSPTLEKAAGSDYQMSVLLLQPSQGTDVSPPSVWLLRAAASWVMNSVIRRLGAGWEGPSKDGLGSKSISEDAQEDAIQRALLSCVCEGCGAGCRE